MKISINKNSLISIIVPIYNVEKYISKCINSIINQTLKNLEIILVDDGSTDSSGSICDKYKNLDSRIIVIHQENKGLSCARNTGLDNANGNLIGFVDGDDYIEKNMYEELLNDMINNNSDISSCNFYYINKNNKILANINNTNTINNEKDKYNNIYSENSALIIHVWNKLYKREVFEEIRFPVGKLFEDTYALCEILEQANTISYIDKPLYNYVKRTDSIVNCFSLNHFDEIDGCDKRIDFLSNKKYYDLINLEKNRKAYSIITNLSKMKIYHINNKEIYDKYYNELVITCKELKWKDSNKYVKRFKVFKRFYILSRSIALGLYYKIKSII